MEAVLLCNRIVISNEVSRLFVTGVQAAVARYHEDGVREPREIRDHVLQKIPRILLHRRW